MAIGVSPDRSSAAPK